MVRYRFANKPLPHKPKPVNVPVTNTVKLEVKEEEQPVEVKIINGKKIEIYKYRL